jgi:DNA-binding transcriptional MocR family regulator
VARPAGSASLAIDARARDLRRGVGLTAWIALEELLLDAAPQPFGSLSVQVSGRVLAARLGVSKDTAAAALRRLASAGLVRREDHRDAARGVFAHSVYVIDAARLDEHGVRRHTAPPSRPTRRGAASVAARAGRAGQASLFDLATVEEP